jgi:predicted ATPase
MLWQHPTKQCAPLFVEEVTRLLLERGEQGGIQAMPPTLQQSLTARLDRLGSAREVAQVGAVIGRDFSYALIRAAASVCSTICCMAALKRMHRDAGAGESRCRSARRNSLRHQDHRQPRE